jgi:hypothetical protein
MHGVWTPSVASSSHGAPASTDVSQPGRVWRRRASPPLVRSRSVRAEGTGRCVLGQIAGGMWRSWCAGGGSSCAAFSSTSGDGSRCGIWSALIRSYAARKKGEANVELVGISACRCVLLDGGIEMPANSVVVVVLRCNDRPGHHDDCVVPAPRILVVRLISRHRPTSSLIWLSPPHLGRSGFRAITRRSETNKTCEW